MHIKHRYLLLTVAWFFAIWVVSSVPQAQLPGIPESGSTLAHFIEYFVLTLLVAKTLDAHDVPFHHHIVAPVLLGMLFLAGADEFHQMIIPGRTASWIDFSFDSIGIIFGFSVYFIINASTSSSRPRR